MVVLNMAHNELHGWLPTPMALAAGVAIDLSFNLFDGPVPVIIPGFSLP
ncbi:hypothetical protein L195_g063027, partial [Trifolium pratense]